MNGEGVFNVRRWMSVLREAGRVSVLRKSSSMLSVISTCLIPAFAQPSSDLRYPAAREVFW